MLTRFIALLVLVAFISSLTGCHRLPKKVTWDASNSNERPRKALTLWSGPPPVFYAHLRRTNPAKEAMIVGHVDVLENNGVSSPQPGATVVIDQRVVFTDAAGNYLCIATPGLHQMRVGAVGLLFSVVPPLRVEQGDSICINFQLRPDPRPIID